MFILPGETSVTSDPERSEPWRRLQYRQFQYEGTHFGLLQALGNCSQEGHQSYR